MQNRVAVKPDYVDSSRRVASEELLDYIGVNYYFRRMVAAPTTPIPTKPSYAAMGFELSDGKDGPLTEIGWEVYPRGMYDIVQRVSKDYKLPIEITENGCSYGDVPDEKGVVPDDRRIAFFRGYLGSVAKAHKQGVPIRAYHAWSLMDNYEWAEGYSQRFGFVFVDFRTLKRTVKQSGKWYAQLAATGKLS